MCAPINFEFPDSQRRLAGPDGRRRRRSRPQDTSTAQLAHEKPYNKHYKLYTVVDIFANREKYTLNISQIIHLHTIEARDSSFVLHPIFVRVFLRLLSCFLVSSLLCLTVVTCYVHCYCRNVYSMSPKNSHSLVYVNRQVNRHQYKKYHAL